MCFHFAGGSAQSFLPWRETFSGVCGLYAAELPGRGRRYGQPFAASLLEAARAFAQTMPALPGRTRIFFGHSLGGLLAFETARHLKRIGAEGPDGLIVSCRPAPDWPVQAQNLPDPSDSALRGYLRSLGGTPDIVFEQKELLAMAASTLRGDLDLIRSYAYSPHPRLALPLSVAGAVDDRIVPFESLLGWRAMTDGPVQIHMFEGGHFALMSRPSAISQIVSSGFAGQGNSCGNTTRRI